MPQSLPIRGAATRSADGWSAATRAPGRLHIEGFRGKPPATQMNESGGSWCRQGTIKDTLPTERRINPLGFESFQIVQPLDKSALHPSGLSSRSAGCRDFLPL